MGIFAGEDTALLAGLSGKRLIGFGKVNLTGIYSPIGTNIAMAGVLIASMIAKSVGKGYGAGVTTSVLAGFTTWIWTAMVPAPYPNIVLTTLAADGNTERSVSLFIGMFAQNAAHAADDVLRAIAFPLAIAVRPIVGVAHACKVSADARR